MQVVHQVIRTAIWMALCCTRHGAVIANQLFFRTTTGRYIILHDDGRYVNPATSSCFVLRLSSAFQRQLEAGREGKMIMVVPRHPVRTKVR